MQIFLTFVTRTRKINSKSIEGQQHSQQNDFSSYCARCIVDNVVLIDEDEVLEYYGEE
jgi:hypothetical protein